MKPEKNLLKQKPKLLLYAGWHFARKLHFGRVHDHDHCEIMLAKEGCGEIIIDEKTYSFSKGDIIIYNPHTAHAEHFAEDTDAEVMFFGISNLSVGCFEPGALSEGKFKILQTGKHYDEFLFYCERLLHEMNAKEFQYSAISDSLLNIIVSFILRLSDAVVTENSNTCLQIKDYLDQNYTSNKSIDDICKDLYINKYYLTHLFKDAMGVPPLKYMINKRISLAKELLKNTSLSIDEIALKCGYTDTSYFIKVFKKSEGVTPQEFKGL